MRCGSPLEALAVLVPSVHSKWKGMIYAAQQLLPERAPEQAPA